MKKAVRLLLCLSVIAAAFIAVSACSSGAGQSQEDTEGNKIGPDRSFTFKGVTLTVPDGFTVVGTADEKIAAHHDESPGSESITFSTASDSIEDYTREKLLSGAEEIVSGKVVGFELKTNTDEKIPFAEYSFEVENGDDVFRVAGFTFFFPDSDAVNVTFTGKSEVFEDTFSLSIESIKAE